MKDRTYSNFECFNTHIQTTALSCWKYRTYGIFECFNIQTALSCWKYRTYGISYTTILIWKLPQSLWNYRMYGTFRRWTAFWRFFMFLCKNLLGQWNLLCYDSSWPLLLIGPLHAVPAFIGGANELMNVVTEHYPWLLCIESLDALWGGGHVILINC